MKKCHRRSDVIDGVMHKRMSL